ncbi:alpha/beta hydrolase [Streptacidiphilus carbonis]|uniref:alpha/beta hydrolase n=1 Tax=Streptacidiphilus carbonis TaxID=105422 RepID=UPI000A3FA285|nr:alpha/beta-hydrolase family protein [Streptacidiphilus carbonis]
MSQQEPEELPEEHPPPGAHRVPPRPHRTVRRRPDWGGLLVAAVFYWLSFTPSLLPRPWWLQVLAAAVTATIGYALGALIARIVRIWFTPPARWRHTAWWALGIGVTAAVVVTTAWSVTWQGDSRRAVGMDPRVTWWQWALVPPIAVLLSALLVLIGRSLRLASGTAARWLGRILPPRLAAACAVVLVAVLVIGIGQGFLLRGVLNVAESSAELANDATSPGIVQPTLPTLSGSPSSLETWDSLGAKGRDFVGQVRTRAQLTAFSGRPAEDPVRVYVGLRSAPTLADRARLAVSELERTGAFKRKVLAVISTTGSGWINQNIANPLEYMYDGDSALVAIQYSYLPSALSVLTEDEAAHAGRALFDAVYARWSSLPAASRPKLLLAGESLGSYATERAFDGSLDELTSRSGGALLLGPTADNPLWQNVSNGRDSGSPLWHPIYQQGRTVRWSQVPADLARPAEPWSTPRVLYLQNGSDPITWWTTDLILHRPGWLRGPRATDVSSGMQWYPFVTFWQVTCDLLGADSVPINHGHRFGTLPVDGWAAVAQPPGWTAQDTERLDALLQQ